MKNLLKISLCGLLPMMGLFASTLEAKEDISLEKAKDIVEGYLPKDSELSEQDVDDMTIELKYFNKTMMEEYEFELNRKNNQILNVESEKMNLAGSYRIAYNDEAILNLVDDEVGELLGSAVSLEEEDGLLEYHVYFQTKDWHGKMEINPETGEILEREISVNPKDFFYDGEILKLDEIKKLAVRYVPDGKIENIVLKDLKKSKVYQVKISDKNKMYLLWIDAESGEKLSLIEKSRFANKDEEKKQWSESNVKISMEEAKLIAMEKAEHGDITELELDCNHGRMVYEGELRDGRLEVEFEIDASDGTILEWNQEFDD